MLPQGLLQLCSVFSAHVAVQLRENPRDDYYHAPERGERREPDSALGNLGQDGEFGLLLPYKTGSGRASA